VGSAIAKDESPKDPKDAKDEPSKDAPASAAHPRYVGSLEDAMAEARERDCLVVVSIHEDG